MTMKNAWNGSSPAKLTDNSGNSFVEVADSDYSEVVKEIAVADLRAGVCPALQIPIPTKIFKVV